MDKLLARFLPKLDRHVSDEQMIAFIDGELGTRKQADVHRHLESCWSCRAKRQQMEATIFALVERRQQLIRRFLPLSQHGEDRFIAQLDQQIDDQRRGWTAFLLALLRRFSIESMNPIVASTLVIFLAAGTLFLIWHHNPATVSANDLLKKAQASERVTVDGTHPGVILQKIVIRTRAHVLERTLYQDRQKKRTVREEHLDSSALRMKQTLEATGLNWDTPLSAIDFGRWRSAQVHAKDAVKQSRDGLITLVTTSSEGTISQESLTLRTSDFHPVNRTIDIRGDEQFEIAELSYATLGWNEVNAELFGPATLQPAPVPRLPAMPPTSEQLDNAELSARLTLYRLNADTNEQIQITRSQTSVHVNGVVDTADRRDNLSRELRKISHVTPSLFSIEELTARPSAAPQLATVQEYSATVWPAPLEKFFLDNSHSMDELSQVSAKLLGAAVAAQRETNVLSELSGRFSATEKLSDSARKALEQLLASHASSLRSSLETEDEILHTLSHASSNDAQSTLPVEAAINAHLKFYGARNVALCKELISANSSSQRSAQLIVADMLATTEALNHTLALLASESGTHP